MKYSCDEQYEYDTRMETSDWRYSAAVLGLLKFFEYWEDHGEPIPYNVDKDYIEYNSCDLTKERYLLFAEHYFSDKMHHRLIEDKLNGEITDEVKKSVSEMLGANTVMKKVFGKIKFDENAQEILDTISTNRLEIIEKTYIYGKSMYANFSNPNMFFNEKNDKTSRLNNYNVDVGRKTKSVSFAWDSSTYVHNDEVEFDFIPFAFSKSRESFFINNNISARQLKSTNELISNSENVRTTLFHDTKGAADFIDYDVEVITTNRDIDYFETLFIRKPAIDILKSITNYSAIKMSLKVNDNYYINFENEVTNSVLNLTKLDRYVEMLLKESAKDSGSTYKYVSNIRVLIEINTKIYGGKDMTSAMKNAYWCAKQVTEKIPENKVNGYKQKLISSITFHDYDRFCEILIQLASFAGVAFDFAYDLFENFEENKNLAYTFINSLNKGGKGND